MTERAPHSVDMADEWRHEKTDQRFWQESYYLDFVSSDGSVGGYARLGIYPNLGAAWWTTFLVGPDRPMVASLAFDLAPTPDLAVREDGFEISLEPEDPLVGFRVRSSTPAQIHDDPAAVYRREPGKDTTLDLDLLWRTDGTPYHYDLTSRYEIPCLVEGEVSVGGERLEVRGQGQRDHSWGERDWWQFGWCWHAARLEDGTRTHGADIRIPGVDVFFGYVQSSGQTSPLGALRVSEELGAEGFPTVGRIEVEPGPIGLRVEPIAFAPILLVGPEGQTSRFPRALARFVADDGREGTGWIEWNQIS